VSAPRNIERERIHAPSAAAGRPHVALVCDLIEENWPSMELVGDMLYRHLELGHSGEFLTEHLCPPMRAHFTRLPLLGGRAVCHDIDRLANRFVDYPRWLGRRTEEFDLFHIIDHSYSQLVHALPAGRTVVTCHDLDTFRCILHPEREHRPRWFRLMAARILNGFRQAAHVITVSKATRNAVLRHRLMPPQRVSVVNNGVHPSCSPAADPAADDAAARLMPTGSGTGPWLLNVGSAIPRKRIDVLLRVLAAVRQEIPEVLLLRVGGELTMEQRDLARDLRVEDAVHVLPPLTREVLAAVYRRADLLLHTADAEGFGLPVIEALASGCPVIASDLDVLRETGGGAAMYCAVADVDAWRSTVVQFLRGVRRETEAGKLHRAQGLQHAARFSWMENARQTAAIYHEVLQRAPRVAA
jgi:glycosyltransferase involved in cell wall biosynthesis